MDKVSFVSLNDELQYPLECSVEAKVPVEFKEDLCGTVRVGEDIFWHMDISKPIRRKKKNERCDKNLTDKEAKRKNKCVKTSEIWRENNLYSKRKISFLLYMQALGVAFGDTLGSEQNGINSDVKVDHCVEEIVDNEHMQKINEVVDDNEFYNEIQSKKTPSNSAKLISEQYYPNLANSFKKVTGTDNIEFDCKSSKVCLKCSIKTPDLKRSFEPYDMSYNLGFLTYSFKISLDQLVEKIDNTKSYKPKKRKHDYDNPPSLDGLDNEEKDKRLKEWENAKRSHEWRMKNVYSTKVPEGNLILKIEVNSQNVYPCLESMEYFVEQEEKTIEQLSVSESINLLHQEEKVDLGPTTSEKKRKHESCDKEHQKSIEQFKKVKYDNEEQKKVEVAKQLELESLMYNEECKEVKNENELSKPKEELLKNEEECKEVKKENEVLENTNEELKKKIKELLKNEEEFKEVKKENEVLKNTFEELKKKNEVLLRNYDEGKEVKKKYEELKKKNEELQKNYDESKKENKELRKKQLDNYATLWGSLHKEDYYNMEWN